MEETGRLQSMGSLRIGTRLSKFTFTFHFHALEKEIATHSSVLAWRIPGTGEPGRLPSGGSHRVGPDWSDLAAVYIPQSYSQFVPPSPSSAVPTSPFPRDVIFFLKHIPKIVSQLRRQFSLAVESSILLIRFWISKPFERTVHWGDVLGRCLQY